MRLHVVSDVHGAAHTLSRAADGADLLCCLGDLVLFMDYAAPERGIIADLFGAEHTRAYIDARTDGRFEDARELAAQAWQSIGLVDPQQRQQAIRERVRHQYGELFAALPEPCLITYGNVDLPDLWPGFLRPGHTVLDGAIADVDGVRIGMVGGGLVSPMRTPYELTPYEYADKLDRLGPVDVLLTHLPPALPGLAYDTVARRFEIASAALADYVEQVQPMVHLFGHVHQPLRTRARIGRTECVNVGHFAATGRPYVLDL